MGGAVFSAAMPIESPVAAYLSQHEKRQPLTQPHQIPHHRHGVLIQLVLVATPRLVETINPGGVPRLAVFDPSSSLDGVSLRQSPSRFDVLEDACGATGVHHESQHTNNLPGDFLRQVARPHRWDSVVFSENLGEHDVPRLSRRGQSFRV